MGTLPSRVPVVVVGGGQAGLSMSYLLKRDGIEHVVIERSTMLNQWRNARWDSFCLVTPNWQCVLPGYRYAGPDPDGFMVQSELLDWLAGYVASFDPPVFENTSVLSVHPRIDGGFEVTTSAGVIETDQVVVATGGYHRARIPALAQRLPETTVQLHSSTYRNPAQLPAGRVLVVGTGQSGSQIAEDLMLAGRDVTLAVGTAPRCARFYRGRDVVAWLNELGQYDKPVTDKPLDERYRDRTNHYLTGRDGGRDIDLRLFTSQGMTLRGHLTGISGGQLQFADDLRANLDAADAVYNGINGLIDDYIAANGIDAEPGEPYRPVWEPPVDQDLTVPVDEFVAVVWATGFTSDYVWLHASAFDGAGHPQHVRGVTEVPDLYFLGLPWLHTWGSGRFAAIARDAEHLASVMGARRGAPVLAASAR